MLASAYIGVVLVFFTVLNGMQDVEAKDEKPQPEICRRTIMTPAAKGSGTTDQRKEEGK